MKKLIQTLLSLGAFGTAALVAQAQPAPKIVVVDMAKLFAGHYETQAKEAELADAKAKATATIDQMRKDGDALVQEYKDLDEQSKNALATPDAKAKALADAQKKMQEIQAKGQDIQTFAQNANGLLQKRASEFRTAVTEEISKIVKTVAARHDATLVLDKSGPSAFGFPIIITADPAYDITDEVAAEIAKSRPATAPAAPSASAPGMEMPATPSSTPASSPDSPQITVPGVTPAK
jgi:outer membrane protein